MLLSFKSDFIRRWKKFIPHIPGVTGQHNFVLPLSGILVFFLCIVGQKSTISCNSILIDFQQQVLHYWISPSESLRQGLWAETMALRWFGHLFLHLKADVCSQLLICDSCTCLSLSSLEDLSSWGLCVLLGCWIRLPSLQANHCRPQYYLFISACPWTGHKYSRDFLESGK